MIERVARAMFEDDNPRNDHWSPSWDTIRDKYVDGPPSHCRDYWRQKARAAIEAMREPTEAMVEAGAMVDEWCQSEGQAAQPDVYRRMIDEALK